MDAIRESFLTFLNSSPALWAWAGNILAAFFIFILGMFAGRWVRRRVRNSRLGGKHIDPTLKPVLASALFYLIIAMTLYAVAIKVGVPPSSLIAIFGAAGLAIGLALKDTLTNIASGIMLLVLRPLEVGEFVDLGGLSGTIKEVGLFATTLKTSEGIYQYIPNSKVWNNRIQNFGRHSIRRFSLDIGLSYDTDLRQAQRVILETLLAARDRIQDAGYPEAHVVSFGDNAVNFTCRVWMPADEWGTRSSDLRIEIFEALNKANIEIPFPQRVMISKNV